MLQRSLLALCALAIGLLPGARAAAPNEYEIKALFLYHFAGFVTWPPTAFENDQSPIVIGVVGEDPFGPYLDKAVAGETAQGRPLSVVRFARPEDVGFCHILFIARSADAQVGDLVARLRRQPVLTVGETENFARRGGVIRFLTNNNRTRFRINITAAKDAGLVISSKLLRAADVIAPGQGRP